MKREYKSVDKSDLFRVIKDSPDQLIVGFDLAKNIQYKNGFSGLTLNGMGGSALPGELIRLFLKQEKSKKSFSVNINRNYSFDYSQHRENQLNIFSSYSGNTEETIAALREGLKLKNPILVMTAGGKLEKIAKKNRLPLIKIPGGVQPRMALGYTFGALLRVLHNAGIVKIKKNELITAAGKIKSCFSSFDKMGRGIAAKIEDRTPVIYSSCDWQAVAMIWKIMINENGKTPAFWNYFPELNHNEMVGFTKPKADFYLLIIKNSKDHPKNLKRMLLTEKMLKKSGIKVSAIEILQGPTIFKIFSILQLGCLISYYLAIHNEEDPTPVRMVEAFKGKMT